jgi:hypothetical protein
MSFIQAILMAVIIFFAVIWSMIWSESNAEYPQMNELIVLNGEISSYFPRRGKTNGSITLSTESGDIELWSRLSEKTTAKFGGLVGRKATAMVDPGTVFVKGGSYHLMHLEFSDGTIVIDYKSTYSKHLSFVANSDNMFMFVEVIIVFLSLLFIYSFYHQRKK